MQGKKLSLIDSILIVAGGMIGSGIFIVSADMGRTVGGSGWLLLLWAVAAIMTVLAALSYGELAGMMPQAGGQYVYLKEAYNPLTGFLYGWTLFTVIQSGTIAAVAVAFAKFSGVLVPAFSEKNILIDLGSFKISAAQILGILCILFLTILNSAGLKYGKIINLFFNSSKIIALFGLIVLGIFVFGNHETWSFNMENLWQTDQLNFDSVTQEWSVTKLAGMALFSAMGVALVGSLFSSDAWNNVTFIAGEIENPKRNIPLSLAVGTLLVSLLYILANVAYLHLLPMQGSPDGSSIMDRGIQFATNDRVGVAAASVMFGNAASFIMAILIMVSTFGCNNGIILSSVRVYQQMAKDGLFFQRMKDNNKNGVPGFALWIQFVWSSILCLSGKYGDLLNYVMFAVMVFYILSILGIFILRKKKPEAERPYKAWGYPVLPALYILLALAFCVNLLITKKEYTIPCFIIVALGIPVYFIWNRSAKSSNS